MHTSVGRPEIGQWYAHTDKGELFQVVGYADQSRTIEIQAFNGDLDEIDDETWNLLPLERSAPPEDWPGPVDDIATGDPEYSDTGIEPRDWMQSLPTLKAAGASWEDTEPVEDRPHVRLLRPRQRR